MTTYLPPRRFQVQLASEWASVDVLLNFILALGVSLRLNHSKLSCDFTASIGTANDNRHAIELITKYKPLLIDHLAHLPTDHPRYPLSLPTELPQAYVPALELLDELTCKQGHKIPVRRKDWRDAMMRHFGCSHWDAKNLEIDIRADKWVVFYDWYAYVERTTPLEEWEKISLKSIKY